MKFGIIENQGRKTLKSVSSSASSLHLNSFSQTLYYYTGNSLADWYLPTPSTVSGQYFYIKNLCPDNSNESISLILHIEGDLSGIWKGGSSGPSTTLTLKPGWAVQLHCDGTNFNVTSFWTPDVPLVST